MRVAGVDGTKGGWVAMILEDGRVVEDLLIPRIETDFAELAGAQMIAIDIPIGYGPREADRAARAYLAGTASVVFPTPTRDLLEQPFAPGRGLSKQSHALGPRIIHVTELAQIDTRLHEAHPEVSFRGMNGGRPLAYRKKSAGGALERLELLRAAGIDPTSLTAAAPAPLDDVLDAAACAWTAERIAAGRARSLPEEPEHLAGRAVAIWY